MDLNGSDCDHAGIFNEEKHFAKLFPKSKKRVWQMKFLVVDDGSTDGTKEILKEYQDDPVVRVITSEKNEGKGAAVRKGILNARCEYAIIQMPI